MRMWGPGGVGTPCCGARCHGDGPQEQTCWCWLEPWGRGQGPPTGYARTRPSAVTRDTSVCTSVHTHVAGRTCWPCTQAHACQASVPGGYPSICQLGTFRLPSDQLNKLFPPSRRSVAREVSPRLSESGLHTWPWLVPTAGVGAGAEGNARGVIKGASLREVKVPPHPVLALPQAPGCCWDKPREQVTGKRAESLISSHFWRRCWWLWLVWDPVSPCPCVPTSPCSQ